MPLTRTPHWATRDLEQHLRVQAKAPFVWSQNDCCTFAANAIQSFTGVDLADSFRGRYTDETSAFALIKTVCGGTTVADAAAYCAQKHGLEEYVGPTGLPQPLFAQRGDLVVMQNAGILIGGCVHLNGRHLVTISENGLVRLPITTAVRAWKV